MTTVPPAGPAVPEEPLPAVGSSPRTDAEALWSARYGWDTESRAGESPQAPGIAAVTDVIASQLAHRSVRRFLPDDVTDAQVSAMVAAAQSASSSSNLQVWSVVEVRDPQTRAQFADLAGDQRQIMAAPVFLVWIADLARAYQIAADAQAPTEGGEYVETMLVAFLDAAIAAQNAAVAAESMGLGLVYVGGVRNDPAWAAALLGLPQRTFAAFGMCVGHPDPARPSRVKPRLPQEVVWHRERYDLAGQSAPIADYDARMAEFYAGQSMAGRWTARIKARLSGPAAMSGRETMKRSLQERGFELR